MHTSIGYHFYNEGLSDRRLEQIATAKSVEDALAGRGYLDKIIDYFRDGVRREEIIELFNNIQSAKTEIYGSVRTGTDEGRLKAFQNLRSLVNPKYLDKFKLKITVEDNSWSYSISVGKINVLTSASMAAGVVLNEALRIQKDIFIEQDLPIIVSKIPEKLVKELNDSGYKKEKCRLLFSELSPASLDKCNSYKTARKEGSYFADQLQDMHKIQDLSETEQHALRDNTLKISSDKNYSSTFFRGIIDVITIDTPGKNSEIYHVTEGTVVPPFKERTGNITCCDGTIVSISSNQTIRIESFIAQFDNPADSKSPLELRCSNRGGSDALPGTIQAGTLRKLLREREFTDIQSLIEGTINDPAFDSGIISNAAHYAIKVLTPEQDNSIDNREKISSKDALIMDLDGLFKPLAGSTSLELAILDYPEIRAYLLNGEQPQSKNKIAEIRSQLHTSFGAMKCFKEITIGQLLAYNCADLSDE